MSMLPDKTRGDMERDKWFLAEGLEKQVFKNFEELKKHFEKDEERKNIEFLEIIESDFINKGYTTYGIKHKGLLSKRPIAYYCPICDDIKIGPPEIEDFNTMKEAPLAGRIGYSVSCENCKIKLYTQTFVWSFKGK